MKKVLHPSTCSFQAYTRYLEAELHVLLEENALLQHALVPRPYNASEEESLFVFPSFAPPLQLKQMVMQETKDGELIIILLPRNSRITAKDFRGRLKQWPYSEVRIEGLKTLDYLDNLSDRKCFRKCFTEQGDAITFEYEVYSLMCGSLVLSFLLQ
ncbi:uncharacterized protein LOC141711209 [Apium graveolens]|uniref:uncharacterized protein LOC141711209 n=1 Tax=Apium graveolens TaxID=4045 RepID=UPI003D78E1B1